MAGHRNILLMIADDLGRETTSCYGSKAVKTPHLDTLAASGTLFDLAFASTASCSGSRTTIYTGLHTHNNGSYGLTQERNGFQTQANIETAPQIFNELGYTTGILGKVHVAPDNLYPWQVREETMTRNVAFIADRAKAFMEEAKQKDNPFFLTIGYVDPHRNMPSRGGFGNIEGNYDARLHDQVYTPDEVDIPSWTSDLPEVRQELAEYYRSIHRMDQGIGLVLQNLEDLGLADNTLVVFMSDNGPPFINSKTTLYDAGVRLPLLVRAPGRNLKPNITNQHMVSWLDVLPTFLDWAGHAGRQPGDGLYRPRPGRSLLPILDRAGADVDPAWSRVFGSHTFHEITNYWPTRYMRDRRYKYHRNVCWRLDFPFATDLYASLSWEGIRNSGDGQRDVLIGKRALRDYIFRPPEELYDLEQDPAEVHNLAADPAHKERLLAMRAELEQWQKDTEDLWLWRDGVSVWRFRSYGYEREGLRIPDRFDVDVDRPGNRDPNMAIVQL